MRKIVIALFIGVLMFGALGCATVATYTETLTSTVQSADLIIDKFQIEKDTINSIHDHAVAMCDAKQLTPKECLTLDTLHKEVVRSFKNQGEKLIAYVDKKNTANLKDYLEAKTEYTALMKQFREMAVTLEIPFKEGK